MNVFPKYQRGIILCGLLSLLTGGIVLADTSNFPDLDLEKNIYFLTPGGDPVQVVAGQYQVEVKEEWLQLTPEDGERFDTILIEAQKGKHEEDLDSPMTISIPGEKEDFLHIVVLLPSGNSLEALGTYSGIRPRGTFFIARSQISKYSSARRMGSTRSRRPNTRVRDHRRTGQQAKDFELAYHWAPIHFRDTEGSGKGDYLTAINYDGDWVGTNNWDNYDKYPLKGVVYYSVSETSTHWFILYGFFHPRDWAKGGGFTIDFEDHENDMEGFLAIVRKDKTPNGQLEGIVTVFHWDFYSFTPKGSRLRSGKEDIDGTLQMKEYDGSNRPLTAQETRGHGLKAYPKVKMKGDYVVYYPSRTRSEVPSSKNDRNVKYKLVDIFEPGGLWSHRKDPALAKTDGTGAYNTKFRGDKSGTCGDGITKTCKADAANFPWGWDDIGVKGVGKDSVARGVIATDPAKLVNSYFGNLGNFSTKYIRNPYVPW